jgi:hypothetical protein
VSTLGSGGPKLSREGRPWRGGRTLAAVALSTWLAAVMAACAPAPTPPLDLGATSVVPADIADADGLARYLADAGVTLTPEGDKTYDWFVPLGRTYALGDGNLVIHTYDSDAAAAEAAAGVSPAGDTVVRPDGTRVGVKWPAAARFYRKGPLVAVYVGTDVQVMHLLALALGDQLAGPAAPPGVGVR